jgi:Protein of unknown function (DUF998)
MMLLAYAAILFASIFVVILILLHFLKPEFDSSWRMISEYEIGQFGWMMRSAFFCWGAALLTMLIAIWPAMNSNAGMISRWWFLLIVLALFGAGIFKTNAITDNTPNTANTIHSLCGAFVILTFPIAATLSVRSLLNNEFWLPGQNLMMLGTIFVWIGLVAFFASIVISRRLDPAAGRVGPKIYLGWPNRFLVLTYVIWIIIIAGNVLRSAG